MELGYYYINLVWHILNTGNFYIKLKANTLLYNNLKITMMYKYKFLGHTNTAVDWHGHIFRGNEKIISCNENIAAMAKKDISLFDIFNNKGEQLVCFEMKDSAMPVKISIARMLNVNPDLVCVLSVKNEAREINHLSQMDVLYKWYRPCFITPQPTIHEDVRKPTIDEIKQKAEELLLLINKMENDKP